MSSKWVLCCNFVSDRAQAILGTVFFKIGLGLFHHPIVFFIAGIIVTCLCGIGLLNFSYENRTFYLWIPQESEVFKEYESNVDYFGTDDAQMSMVFHELDDGNLLTPDNMDAMYEMFNLGLNVTSEFDGKTWTFENLCARDYENAALCSVFESFFGLFGIFGFDKNNWATQSLIQSYIDNYFAYIDVYAAGWLTNDTTGDYYGCSYVRLIILLQGSKNTTIQDASEEYQYAWEDYWKSNSENWQSSNNMEMEFLTDSSFGPELDRTLSSDIPVFGGAFVVMLVYLSLTIGKFNCVEARPLVAIGSLLSTICAIVIGFGLGCAFGQTLNAIVMLIPFILLGVGVDDDIIIVETLNRTPLPNNDISKEDERFGKALKHAGLSITLTSFSSIIAFAIGSAIDLPGISAFCIFASLTFLANYVSQLLIFVPVLTYDERRISGGRNFCICCIKHGDFDYHKSMEMIGHNYQENNNNNDGRSNDDTTKTNEESKKKDWHRFLSVEYILIHGLAPLVNKLTFRVIVYLIFIGLYVGSILSFNSLDTETDVTKFVPDDSFILTYISVFIAGFGAIVYEDFDFVIENIDFSDESERDVVLSTIDYFDNNFTSSRGGFVTSISHWVYDFDSYLDTQYNLSINNVSSSEFYTLLQEFTSYSDYQVWYDYIVYDNDDSPTEIAATRFTATVTYSKYLLNRWKFRGQVVSAFEEQMGSSKDGYAFAIGFLLAYLADTIVSLTINNLTFALLGVFVVLAILMDFRMAVFVSILIAFIDIDLVGWMAINSLALDTVAYGQLVMAVGLTVDYIIHIAHAIVDAQPKDRNNYQERLHIAFHDMGVGVAKGALTTFLGIMTLIFSQSEVFRIFFVMFCGIIIVSVIHGFILLPCLLADLPFMYHIHVEINENDSTQSITRSQAAPSTTETQQNAPGQTSMEMVDTTEAQED